MAFINVKIQIFLCGSAQCKKAACGLCGFCARSLVFPVRMPGYAYICSNMPYFVPVPLGEDFVV
jgi:hypothetical protein